MSNAKTKAQPTPATPDQICAAYEALTPAELAKLHRYARWRLRALGSRQIGRDEDEFVKDAFISLLDGRRTWLPENVSFYTCFRGVIRSQTHNLRTKGPEDAFDQLKSIHSKNEESKTDPLDRFSSTVTEDPETELEWKQIRGLIKDRFGDDHEAALMLEARLDGQSPEGIRDGLQLTQKQYETILKRVRRAIKKILNGGQS